MERVQEPHELMDDDEQARAYAEADFEASHEGFVQRFREYFPDYDGSGTILDLGCGPVDITLRFARRYTGAMLHGVDASPAMLRQARLALAKADPAVTSRIHLIEGYIPGVALPASAYDVIYSNNLLHHLPDPQALWKTVRQYARAGTRVFVGDLYRPASPEDARQIVEAYSGDEPEVLKTDFYNSLLAAFAPEEVVQQLAEAGFAHFVVSTVSDRHLNVYGIVG